MAVFRAVSYEEKEYLIAEFFELFLPKFMDNAEKMLEDQGGKYFAGENVSYFCKQIFIMPNIILYLKSSTFCSNQVGVQWPIVKLC